MDVLELIQDAGREQFQQPGAMWMPELQLTYALSVLKRARWDDYTIPRLRRSCMIVAPKNTTKTSTVERYFNEYVLARNYLAVPDDHSGPTYYEFQSGTSWERIRGGIADGTLMMPIARRTDLLLCGELFDFLGHNAQHRKGRIDALNTFLESGEMSVNLVKMSGVPLSLDERSRAEAAGITYKENDGSLFYNVVVPMIACTRHFEMDEFRDVNNSGLLSRFAVSAWFPNDEEYLAYNKALRKPLRTPRHKTKIIELNQQLRAIKWGFIPYPPDDMLNKAHDYLWDLLDEVERDNGISPVETRGARDIGFVAQCLTGSAMLRTAFSRLGESDVDIKRLEYDHKDVEWSKFFIDMRATALMHMIEKYDMAKHGKRKDVRGLDVNEDLVDIITSFVAPEQPTDEEVDQEDLLPDRRDFPAKELIQHIMGGSSERRPCKQTQAYNLVKKMVSLGYLVRPKAGLLAIGEELWQKRYVAPDDKWVGM